MGGRKSWGEESVGGKGVFLSPTLKGRSGHPGAGVEETGAKTLRALVQVAKGGIAAAPL